MILPQKTRLPEGVNLLVLNSVIGPYHLAPGDTLHVNYQNKRLKIRCRGVWFSCLCFKIAGYTVRTVGTVQQEFFNA